MKLSVKIRIILFVFQRKRKALKDFFFFFYLCQVYIEKLKVENVSSNKYTVYSSDILTNPSGVGKSFSKEIDRLYFKEKIRCITKYIRAKKNI